MPHFAVPTTKYTKVADGLVIKKVHKNDSGEYTCKAYQVSTTISNTKEQTIRLNIQREFVWLWLTEANERQWGYYN